MSRAHSTLGLALCLTGMIGLAHKPVAGLQAGAAVEAAGPISTTAQTVAFAAPVHVNVRALDLNQLALSDFGDLDLQ